MNELLTAAVIYYLVASINIGCYIFVIFNRAPVWLRFGAVGVGLLVCWNVVKTTSTFIEFLLR